jgi:hypothetical protein
MATAVGKITTTAITQQYSTKPGVRILVEQNPNTGALDITYRKTGPNVVAVRVTGAVTVAGSRQCRYQLQTSAGTLTCSPSQTHWLARDKDRDALRAIAFDDTVRDASVTTEEPTRHTAEEVYDFAIHAAAGGHGPELTVPEVIAPNHTPVLVENVTEVVTWPTYEHQASENSGKTWRTVAVGLSTVDVFRIRNGNTGAEGRDFRFVSESAVGVGDPTPRPEPADDFGPVDAVYVPGDRVNVRDYTGRLSAGIVAEVDVPVFRDGRDPQPWDTAYTVRTPVSGSVYVDTERMRPELPIEVGQAWTATNSKGEPATMTIGSIEPCGIIVNGVDYRPRGIALSSYIWAQITSGPHEPNGTVKRCDVGGEELTGPYWLLHGLGRGWEGDRGAACAFHTGQPEPEQTPDAGPVPRDGYARYVEAAAERATIAAQLAEVEATRDEIPPGSRRPPVRAQEASDRHAATLRRQLDEAYVSPWGSV